MQAIRNNEVKACKIGNLKERGYGLEFDEGVLGGS